MYRVTANKGFVSEKMPIDRAVIYAYDLEKLGNVNVRVVPV